MTHAYAHPPATPEQLTSIREKAQKMPESTKNLILELVAGIERRDESIKNFKTRDEEQETRFREIHKAAGDLNKYLGYGMPS